MNRALLQKLFSLVEANLANENFGPEELAKEAGMSQSNLNRKLKSISNQTISQFIREIRLKKAKELLQDGDLTVAEISYRVGFGSPTYFNKCFHEYFGFAPGEMRNQEHKPEPEPEEKNPEIPPKKFNRTKILIVLVAALIIAVPITIFIWHPFSNQKADKSIGVLPFSYLGDEPEKQFQADGMMNIIQSYLSKIYDLSVISVTSVEQYRNTEKTAITIGEELDVAYLLEGRLLKVGNQLKLILQLIDAKNDSHVWATEYNGDREKITAKLNIAAEEIADNLHAKITEEEKQNIRKVQTSNFSALDFYQVGKSQLSKYNPFDSEPDPLNEAQISFNKSLQCDSSFALAYAGLAEIYWIKYEWGNKNKDKFLDSVFSMANQALFYDNRCADAYIFRGLYYNDLGKKRQALNDAEKALKCNPNDKRAYTTWFEINQDYDNVDDWIKAVAAHYEVIKRFGAEDKIHSLFWLSWGYDAYGFYELSRKCTLQRLELSHDSGAFYYHMQWVEFNAGHFEEAYRYAVKRFEFEKDTTYNDPESIQYCTYSGHHEEAYKWAKTYVEHCKKTGKSIRLLHRVAYAYWKVGKIKEAEEFYELELENYFKSVKQRELEGIKEQGGYNIVTSIDYAMLGEKEKAIQYINYLENPSIPMFALVILKYDPAYNEIREDPRFQKVLQAFEAHFQAKHDKLKKWLEEQGYI